MVIGGVEFKIREAATPRLQEVTDTSDIFPEQLEGRVLRLAWANHACIYSCDDCISEIKRSHVFRGSEVYTNLDVSEVGKGDIVTLAGCGDPLCHPLLYEYVDQACAEIKERGASVVVRSRWPGTELGETNITHLMLDYNAYYGTLSYFEIVAEAALSAGIKVIPTISYVRANRKARAKIDEFIGFVEKNNDLSRTIMFAPPIVPADSKEHNQFIEVLPNTSVICGANYYLEKDAMKVYSYIRRNTHLRVITDFRLYAGR